MAVAAFALHGWPGSHVVSVKADIAALPGFPSTSSAGLHSLAQSVLLSLEGWLPKQRGNGYQNEDCGNGLKQVGVC